MQKCITLFVIGVMFLSRLVTAQEFRDSQVGSEECKSCSCRGFDFDKVLNEVNAKIANLSSVINQKEVELYTLYDEFNRTRDIEILEEIIKFEEEVQLLRSELELYKRQRLNLMLIKKYTRKTAYGIEILYYRLPRESKLVEKYVEELNPVKKDVNLGWLIAFYRQASELTFDDYIEVDMRLRDTLKEIKAGNGTIEDALKLIRERRKLWSEIYRYLEERDKLQTIKTLRELGRRQTIMKTLGIVSYREDEVIYHSELALRYPCTETNIDGTPYCGVNSLKQVLPSYNYPGTPFFEDLTLIAVWVGVYSSSEPNRDYYLGEFCTYTFKEESRLHEYWELARYYDSRAKSVQIKYFYDGIAYNPSMGEYQIVNLIWQFECNSATTCWVTSYRPRLPYPNNPLTIPNGEYVIRVFSRALRSNCCRSSSSHDNPYGCHWSNRHCEACFAPDDSASQNFPHEDRSGWIYIPQENS